MKLIIAINKLGYIGLDGKLPWRNLKDLSHFRQMTLGQKLIVGSGTFLKLPPLPQRELLVVGRDFMSLSEALGRRPDWIIGGKMLYESLMPLTTEAHISIIDDYTLGDTLAPDFTHYGGKKFFYKF